MSEETESAKRGRLRADVLDVVKLLTSAYHDGARCLGSKARDIQEVLEQDRGWKKDDFRDFRGGSSLYRAVDRALQYHRRAGVIAHDPVDGWELVR